jgi:glutathione S-transferase
MKLYYLPISTYSQKVALGLYELGLEFEPISVQPSAPENPGPFGKLPVLRTDDGSILYESTSILEHAGDWTRDGKRLVPRDDAAAREARHWDRLADLYLNNPCATLFFDARKPVEARDAEAVKRAERHIDAFYTLAEKQLAGKSFVVGDGPTIADCAVMSGLGLASRVRPFHAYAAVRGYFVRFAERPSFARVQAEALPAWKRMESAA